ncbi:MAG: helix-turn-helix domain-containing protein [Candidatus Acidiferrales bacterium]
MHTKIGTGTLRAVIEAYVRKVLADCGGCRLKAARELGIGRTTLYRWLKRQGRKPKDARTRNGNNMP